MHAGDEEARCGSNQGIFRGECYGACCTPLQAASGGVALRAITPGPCGSAERIEDQERENRTLQEQWTEVLGDKALNIEREYCEDLSASHRSRTGLYMS